MDSSGWLAIGIIGVALLTLLYFLPTYIAFKRNHDHKWIIFAINFVLPQSYPALTLYIRTNGVVPDT
jgi:hypothetical protein